MNEIFVNDSKNSVLKQKMLGLCVNEGNYCIAEMSRELGTSIPTVTKLVGELIDEGFIEDMGKQGTNGGRRPSIYGLSPSAGYFVGTDVRKSHISIAVTNFRGQIIDYHEDIPYTLESTEKSFQNICAIIKANLDKIGIDAGKVKAYGFSLTGRVNNASGYSFSYFMGEDRPLATILEGELGAPVFIENDSRSMTYGEYLSGVCNNERNVLFLNVSWGLGMGMIMDGNLIYGKSGFSGEVGHFPFLNNNQICRCGKIGCLETEASGSAVHRKVLEKLQEGHQSMLSDKYNKGEEITLDDIMDALLEEDILAIETVEEVGNVLGRAIAGLINIFNPELVVIGGRMTAAKDYLSLPLKSAIKKHSLNIVNKDTTLKFSKLGKKGASVGACMLSRSKLLGLI